MCNSDARKKHSIAIVAPFPPPYGGMALQAKKLFGRLNESGIDSFFIKSNVPFPSSLEFLEGVKGLRTVCRFVIFFLNLFHLRKATVVHIFGASHLYFFLVVVPSLLVGNLLGKKTILNYRGGEAEKFLNIWGFLAIPLLKKADIIAVPSHFLKNFFDNIMAKEVVILPNLMEMADFQYRERSKLKPSIIVSRQLEPLYNIACALKAFEIIKRHYPEARMQIAGIGSDEKRLKKLEEEMALEGINFIGALPHEKLSQIYNECDIMVNSSNADNFPGSVLEAFACGMPVVTTRVGGIPFMVKDGENGILVDPNDYIGLANGVIKLLENPELALKFSRNGRQMAERHKWENVREVLFNLYGLKKCNSI